MLRVCVCFFFNDTATTEIYTLSLHDALPIYTWHGAAGGRIQVWLGPHAPYTCPPDFLRAVAAAARQSGLGCHIRSEEHTSELQSRQYLVCRLLLEKKKRTNEQHLAIQ